MEMWVNGLHSICNIDTCGLPDMLCTPSALRQASFGPQGVHIRQTTRAHVTYTKCTVFIPCTISQN